MAVFTSLVAADRSQHQSTAPYGLGPDINITVRRSHLYEDAFDKLSPTNGMLEVSTFENVWKVSEVFLKRLYLFILFFIYSFIYFFAISSYLKVERQLFLLIKNIK